MKRKHYITSSILVQKCLFVYVFYLKNFIRFPFKFLYLMYYIYIYIWSIDYIKCTIYTTFRIYEILYHNSSFVYLNFTATIIVEKNIYLNNPTIIWVGELAFMLMFDNAIDIMLEGILRREQNTKYTFFLSYFSMRS